LTRNNQNFLAGYQPERLIEQIPGRPAQATIPHQKTKSFEISAAWMQTIFIRTDATTRGGR
jgi:hypothetical protein